MFSLMKYSVRFTAGHCFRLQIYFPRSFVTRGGTRSLNCPHMILSVPFAVGHFSSFVQAGVGCSPWLFPAHSVKLSHSHLCRLKTYLQKTPCVTTSVCLLLTRTCSYLPAQRQCLCLSSEDAFVYISVFSVSLHRLSAFWPRDHYCSLLVEAYSLIIKT